MEGRPLPQRGRPGAHRGRGRPDGQEVARHRADPGRVGRRACSPVLVDQAGAHAAVAKYNQLALSLVNCVFTEEEDASCETAEESPSPGETGSRPTSGVASATEGRARATTPRRRPEGTAATGTPLPTLPPWDGKERLNVLLVGVRRSARASRRFNTDTLIVVSIDPETSRSRCSRCRATWSTCRCRRTPAALWG